MKRNRNGHMQFRSLCGSSSVDVLPSVGRSRSWNNFPFGHSRRGLPQLSPIPGEQNVPVGSRYGFPSKCSHIVRVFCFWIKKRLPRLELSGENFIVYLRSPRGTRRAALQMIPLARIFIVFAGTLTGLLSFSFGIALALVKPTPPGL